MREKVASLRPVDRLINWLGSRGFLWLVLIIFIFECAWIAFSAAYPQAFDENFHYGLIKVYSHYWLPFLSRQPPGANSYGAVARDPSYLYHYLMSFPYRLLALWLHTQSEQVIALRLIDVGMFSVGLVLFRRVLRRIGLSRGLANVSLLLFALIPIVPQLAAQVNYDDLLFPLVAAVCLLTFRVIDQIRAGRPRLSSLIILYALSMLTSLVTYVFLPILLGVALFVAVLIWQHYRHALRKLFSLLADSWRSLSWPLKVGLIILPLVATGLWLQRDGYNLLKYHSVVPDCASVLNVKDCSAYSPWYVDYLRHNKLVAGTATINSNLPVYTVKWFYWMWYRLFFAVNGKASNFTNYPPLPLPSLAFALIALICLAAVIVWRKRLKNNPFLLFLAVICGIYLISLFLKGYATYNYTAVEENMNGRYLIPILLPLAAIGGAALSLALSRLHTQKVLLVVVILALFLQGGGALTFMVDSDSSWYFQNPTVQKVNHAANKVTRRLVVHRPHPTAS